jgi:hypothetical protein
MIDDKQEKLELKPGERRSCEVLKGDMEKVMGLRNLLT